MHAFEVLAHAVQHLPMGLLLLVVLAFQVFDGSFEVFYLQRVGLLLLQQSLLFLIQLPFLTRIERTLHRLEQLQLVLLEVAALGHEELLDPAHLLLEAHLSLDLGVALGQLEVLALHLFGLLPEEHVLLGELVVVLFEYVLGLEGVLEAELHDADQFDDELLGIALEVFLVDV